MAPIPPWFGGMRAYKIILRLSELWLYVRENILANTPDSALYLQKLPNLGRCNACVYLHTGAAQGGSGQGNNLH